MTCIMIILWLAEEGLSEYWKISGWLSTLGFHIYLPNATITVITLDVSTVSALNCVHIFVMCHNIHTTCSALYILDSQRLLTYMKLHLPKNPTKFQGKVFRYDCSVTNSTETFPPRYTYGTSIGTNVPLSGPCSRWWYWQNDDTLGWTELDRIEL